MSEAPVLFSPVLDQDPVRVCLDCLSEGFQIIGFDWRYVYVNPAAARHGRRDPSELMGQPLSEMYPGIERTELFDVLRRCMAERNARILENRFTFPDGTQRWFELRIQPVPSGICIYSSDIDERKQRESARAQGTLPQQTGLFATLRRLLRRR